MNGCWQDGDLRAFADGELPVQSRQEIAGHLEICSACGARYRELSDRAAWVSGVMALAEGTSEVSTPRKRPRLWPAAVLPLAAVVAMAFVLLQKRAPVRPVVPVSAAAAPPAPAQTAAPAVMHPAVTHSAAMHPAAQRPAPRPSAPGEEFVRLDDDPIETATVVRISADNGALQADLIIGPDGRAHAIRIVRNR
jgi:anti-sigma factor RsiW